MLHQLFPNISLPFYLADSHPNIVGRITGDGGCFFSITDICTHPSHRGQGLAKAVMAELTRWLEVEEHVPKGAWVGLSADGQAGGLYRQFGFRETKEAFDSVGMARVM